jgi:hypothetical protein
MPVLQKQNQKQNEKQNQKQNEKQNPKTKPVSTMVKSIRIKNKAPSKLMKGGGLKLSILGLHMAIAAGSSVAIPVILGMSVVVPNSIKIYQTVKEYYRPFMKDTDFKLYIKNYVHNLNADIVANPIKIDTEVIAFVNALMIKVVFIMMIKIRAFNQGIFNAINPFARNELEFNSFAIIIRNLYSEEYCQGLEKRVKLIPKTPILPSQIFYSDQYPFDESKGFIFGIETETEKNIFNVIVEIEILVNKNARVGFAPFGITKFNLMEGNGEYFYKPSKLASQSFAFSIYYLMEQIINSSLKFMGNSTTIDYNSVKTGLLENNNLKQSLILLNIIDKEFYV